jgi:MFS family permease
VQAGFLLSLVQLAGMTVGVVFGVVADSLGSRRSMTLGLVVLAIVSALGGLTQGVAPLMLLRAAEASASCSSCCRRRAWCARWSSRSGVSAMLGLWGAYMPLATATGAAVSGRWRSRLSAGAAGGARWPRCPARWRCGSGTPCRQDAAPAAARIAAAVARAAAPDTGRARPVARSPCRSRCTRANGWR